MRTWTAALAALVLTACATAPREDATTTLSIGIPVNDAQTQAVPAVFSEPRGAGPFAAVVVLSGCAGVLPDLGIAERLRGDYLPHGIATLVVDSFKPRGYTEVCSDQKLLMSSIEFRVRDIRAAVAWLGARPEIDPRRIFLQGYSHGAIAAIAAIDAQRPIEQPKVAGVVAYYPYCSSGSRFSVPTIILVGRLDDWTPAQRCEAIADKTNLELTVYPEGLHAFATPRLAPMNYLGHRLGYNAAATDDAQRRALQLIQSVGR